MRVGEGEEGPTPSVCRGTNRVGVTDTQLVRGSVRRTRGGGLGSRDTLPGRPPSGPPVPLTAAPPGGDVYVEGVDVVDTLVDVVPTRDPRLVSFPEEHGSGGNGESTEPDWGRTQSHVPDPVETRSPGPRTLFCVGRGNNGPCSWSVHCPVPPLTFLSLEVVDHQRLEDPTAPEGPHRSPPPPKQRSKTYLHDRENRLLLYVCVSCKPLDPGQVVSVAHTRTHTYTHAHTHMRT